VAVGATNRRDRLRAATQDQHGALDAMIGERQHFSSRAGYGCWLRGGYAFHRAIHRALATSGLYPAPSLENLRRRTHLLADDLRDLGLTPDTPLTPLPVLAAPDMAAALGILYVTEGATLGARVLLLRARALGLDATFGARHLSFAAQSYLPWRDFLGTLEASNLDSPGEQRMIDAARQAFAAAMVYFGDRVPPAVPAYVAGASTGRLPSTPL